MIKMSYRQMLGFALALMASPALAATKQDYIAELEKFLPNPNAMPQSMRAVQILLNENNPGKFLRGQVDIIRAMVVIGEARNDRNLLNQAKSILIASNRVVDDGLDNPDHYIISQVAFSLPELVYAYQHLKALNLLDAQDTARTEKMLKMCADYWLAQRPTAGSGNLDTRYAEGVALVANAFPEDAHAAKWRSWSENIFNALLEYPSVAERTQKRSLQRLGNGWKLLPDPHQPPFRTAPGGGENCNGYVAATLLSWIGLGEALGKHAQLTKPEVRAWLDGFYQQVMPSGILPNYGDSSWGPTPEWMGVFEWMGHAFRRPEYRWAAETVLQYEIAQHATPSDTSFVIPFVDESVPVASAARHSVLLKRQSSYGQPIPDKIILRGPQPPAEAPFVMVQAVHGGGHSHPFGGAIGSYALGQSVILHDAGYDATSSVYHNMFLMRPASEDFLGFVGDPSGTLQDKVTDGKGGRRIPSPDRIATDAQSHDFQKIAYGRVTFDCVTAFEPDKSFDNRAYVQTRETALDKDTGTLVVLDTLTALSDGPLQAGPVWHTQAIIAQNSRGFLIQNDQVFKIDGVTFTTPPRPIWVAMAGSAPMQISSQHWHFIVRHGLEDNPQQEHLYARYAGPMKAGNTILFLTVFKPQGSATLPSDVQLQVKGGMATAKIGSWTYSFQPGAKGASPRFEAQSSEDSYKATVSAENAVSETP